MVFHLIFYRRTSWVPRCNIGIADRYCGATSSLMTYGSSRLRGQRAHPTVRVHEKSTLPYTGGWGSSDTLALPYREIRGLSLLNLYTSTKKGYWVCPTRPSQDKKECYLRHITPPPLPTHRELGYWIPIMNFQLMFFCFYF